MKIQEMNKNNRFYSIIILIIVIVGVALRFYNLSFQSLWGDEARWLYVIQGNISYNLKILAEDCHLPLYNLIMHYWTKIFGISEYAARFISAFFGSLSIFITYLISKEIFDKKTGIFASVLVALSSFLIYFSQQVRPYSLLIFLCLLSYYFMLNVVNSRNQVNTSMYIISSILLLYTHVFSIFLILSQNFYILTTNWKKEKIKFLINWFTYQIIIAISFIPWINILFRQAQIAKYTDLLYWIDYPSIFGTGDFSILGTFIQFSGDLLLFFIFTTLIIIYLLKNVSRINSNQNILLLSWIFIPILLSFSYSFIISPIFESKNLIFTAIPFYILVSASIKKLFKNKKSYVAISAIALYCFLLIFSHSTIFGFQEEYFINEDWRAASDFIKDKKENEPVAIVHPSYIYPFIYYYDDDCFKEKNIINCSEVLGIYQWEEDKLDPPFWLIISGVNSSDIFSKNLSGTYTYKKEYKFIDIIKYD